MISAARPDVVVMDVMMPRLDGIETTRALRAAGNDVPGLVLTARDAVGDRVSGLDAGADDYLTKPSALEELLARLRALLLPSDGRLVLRRSLTWLTELPGRAVERANLGRLLPRRSPAASR